MLKFKHNKYFDRVKWFAFCAFVLLTTVWVMSFPCMAQGADNNNLIRLHVLANSDESKDQELKNIIRDQVLIELETLKSITSTKEALKYLKENLEPLKFKLEQKMNEVGFSYPLEIKFTESDFPTRKYHNIILPAGKYLALKVIIGEGQGANWWCVLFPPICHGDLVREPSDKLVDDSKVLPTISTLKKEKGKDYDLKKIWTEYTKVLLKVWSFSKSP